MTGCSFAHVLQYEDVVRLICLYYLLRRYNPLPRLNRSGELQ